MIKMEFLFPHQEPRKVQSALMQQIYSCIENKQNLLAHAPTGIGKTASYLAPALTYAIKNEKTLFFLTPRHSQHHIVIETTKKIQKKFNTDFKVVDFIGKKHMCLQPGVDILSNSEFHEYCRELRKKDNCEFYLNLKSKTQRNLCLSEIKEPLHVEELVKHCSKHNLCPYEIAALLGKKAKVIIADYYHILSPTVRESLFNRLQIDLSNCIIYFDESHNLPDRCRDLLTTNISSITLDYALREDKAFKFSFEDELLNIQNNLSQLSKTIPIEKQEVLVKKEDFVVNLDLIEDLKWAADEVRDKQKRSSLGTVANFLESWLGPDRSFIRVISNGFTKIGKPFINLSYRCLDPSLLISQLTAHSLIFMSGTLSPTEMYLDLLGLDKNKTVTTEFSNPFPQQNRLNLIVPTVTTKYTKRDEAMYKKISKICSEITNIVPGNTAIFFPSYDLLNKINLTFLNESEKTVFIEKPGLSKLERQEMIDKFKSYNKSGAVLLGAASGSFGEGIDLPGDFLKCVIVVGLPLAKPDIETQELISYYDELFAKGWDYAYIYPAIITSLQNAGRCIRSETDKGCIVFLDERYSWQSYKKCFPSDANFETTKIPVPRIKEFFENNN
ncbi:ATP-dependent DNA helicase [Candidatus Woesearchaeota archaeon]|nr:ATP-dependent DNA helicase [Candidatus Woesearchaeota archaeon]